MKTLKLVFTFVLCFLLVGLLACVEIPDDLKKIIELKINYQGDKYYDKDWRRTNLKLLYHPDDNFLGSSFQYKTLSVSPADLYGTLIFSKFSIEEIIVGKEDLVLTGVNGDTHKVKDEKCYFIRLKYTVVARIYSAKKYDVFKTPRDFDWYWLLIKDTHDGMYKIYDELPSFKVTFTKLDSFLSHKSYFSNGEEVAGKIFQ